MSDDGSENVTRTKRNKGSDSTSEDLEEAQIVQVTTPAKPVKPRVRRKAFRLSDSKKSTKKKEKVDEKEASNCKPRWRVPEVERTRP